MNSTIFVVIGSGQNSFFLTVALSFVSKLGKRVKIEHLTKSTKKIFQGTSPEISRLIFRFELIPSKVAKFNFKESPLKNIRDRTSFRT